MIRHFSPSFGKLVGGAKNYKIIYDEWMISPDRSKIFICIPKCATKSTVSLLKKSFNYLHVESTIHESDITNYTYDNSQFYAIVRDPVKRYVSGITQFLTFHNETNIEILERLFKNKKFIFDEHTLPQKFYLENVLKNYQVKFIKLDSCIDEKLSNVLNCTVELPKLNKSKDASISHIANSLYEKFCVNDKEFYNLYHEDFELYKIAS